MTFELYLSACATNLKMSFGVVSFILSAYLSIRIVFYYTAMSNQKEWGISNAKLNKKEWSLLFLTMLTLFSIIVAVLLPTTAQYTKIIKQQKQCKISLSQ